eukprot:811376-Pelagomonas_calceolata.AAC.1
MSSPGLRAWSRCTAVGNGPCSSQRAASPQPHPAAPAARGKHDRAILEKQQLLLRGCSAEAVRRSCMCKSVADALEKFSTLLMRRFAWRLH